MQEETPSDEHYEIRRDVIRRVDNLVRSGLRGHKGMHVEHYGSFTSGLFTPSGDLDIAIEGTLKLENSNQPRQDTASYWCTFRACLLPFTGEGSLVVRLIIS